MIIKYKHIVRKRTINNLILRLQRKGCILYPVYNLVIINKKSREKKGKLIEKLGIFNPNFNERIFFFDSSKLYYWIQRGLIIHFKVKNYLMKFLISNIN